MSDIGDYIYSNISEDFDIICGIPYGGLPLATYISTKYNKPMIMLRSSKKEYGMQKLIEGKYNKYWNRLWHDFSVGLNYVIF